MVLTGRWSLRQRQVKEARPDPGAGDRMARQGMRIHAYNCRGGWERPARIQHKGGGRYGFDQRWLDALCRAVGDWDFV